MVLYFKTSSSIPDYIRQAVLDSILFLEILDSGKLASTGDKEQDAARALAMPNKRKNHAVIRVPFRTPIPIPDGNPDEFYFGLMVSVELANTSIESNRAYYQHNVTKGEVRLHILPYQGSHNACLTSFSVTLADGLRVRNLVEFIGLMKLDSFDFSMVGSAFVGCRDYVIQLLLHLANARLIIEFCHQKVQNKSPVHICDHLNYRYYPCDEYGRRPAPTPNKVDQGFFSNPDYDRILWPQQTST